MPRASIAKRRRWNNWLILGIIAFMVILNAPSLIKAYLIGEPSTPIVSDASLSESQAALPKLLNPNYPVSALYYRGVEIELKDGKLVSNVKLKDDVPPPDIIERWRSIEGTLVSPENFDTMQASLGNPETIEVWYQGLDEPHRITLYKTEQFWLLKNWQDDWIAITVDPDFLQPRY
ncbi:hypothetical protein H4F17_16335 [Vibrio cholerae]